MDSLMLQRDSSLVKSCLHLILLAMVAEHMRWFRYVWGKC